MSSKRAKSETPKGSGAVVFNMVYLVAHICTFIPNTQLSNVKRANKTAKLAFDKNKTMDERRQRGVLEQYARLDWICYRSATRRSVHKRDGALDTFTVCYDCNGLLESPLNGNENSRYFKTTEAKEMRCFPCKVLEAQLLCAQKGDIKAVAAASAKLVGLFNRGLVASDDQRKVVKEEERHDPDKHLAWLRKSFPYEPSDDDEEEDACEGGDGECWGEGDFCEHCDHHTCTEHMEETSAGESVCHFCADEARDDEDE